MFNVRTSPLSDTSFSFCSYSTVKNASNHFGKITQKSKYCEHSWPLLFSDSGYFMKFDTSSGAAGSSALLESRILYPKRDEQCLQFFYKMTGPAGDKLVIWIRTDDGTGVVRSVKKIHTIIGILLHHLYASIENTFFLTSETVC